MIVYLYNGNPQTWKDHLYTGTGSCVLLTRKKEFPLTWKKKKKFWDSWEFIFILSNYVWSG